MILPGLVLVVVVLILFALLMLGCTSHLRLLLHPIFLIRISCRRLSVILRMNTFVISIGFNPAQLRSLFGIPLLLVLEEIFLYYRNTTLHK